MKHTRIKEMKGDMKEEVKIIPTIFISYKDLPQAKSWKIGKTYELFIKAKQVSMNEHNATFEIEKVEPYEEEE